MLATTTHSDSATFIWSPQHDKLAYVTSAGLQVYVMDARTDSEHHHTLSTAVFAELVWSPDGTYLTARQPNGRWSIYGFELGAVHCLYSAKATSLDWIDTDQVLYIPDAGGLVLVYLDGLHPPHAIPLAG